MNINRCPALATAAVLAAGLAVAVAPAASAAQNSSGTLRPTQETCVSQYASYQVRGQGTATQDGARFRLLRNGVKVDDTFGRVGAVGFERRTAFANFPGPGTYTLCAKNTGTRDTVVALTLRTDGEIF